MKKCAIIFVSFFSVILSFSAMFSAQALQQERLLIESSVKEFINYLPGNVYWKDKSGVYLGCNEQQALTLSLDSPEGIVGKTVYDLVPQDMAKIIEQNDIEIMQHGHEVKKIEQGYDTKGQLVNYISLKKPIKDDVGKVIGLIGISFIEKN